MLSPSLVKTPALSAPSSRALYSPAELRPLLAPTSIVIVDFSSKPASFGSRTWANLADSGIPVHLVNPKRAADKAARIHSAVSDLPRDIDCAIIAVPRDVVEEVAQACAQMGVKGAIVYASGYAETGQPEHRQMQERLTALSQRTGMRILGPNCIGIVSESGSLRMTFGETPELPQKHANRIGIVSQSGGLGYALSQSSAHGYCISHVLTAGNSCDVDVADQINFLAADPACKVIACLFEGMADPMRLLEAGHAAARAGKPVIVLKLATGSEGIQAAMSHTGSLAGSAEVYRAAFARAGFVEVDDFEALIETAAFFAKAGVPTATGVAALATSGGATIMVADKAERHGVALPQPGTEVADMLKALIPEFGSARNPCDVTAQILSDPQSLPRCARAMLEDPAYGALVIPHPYAYASGTARLLALAEVAEAVGKPICCVWLSQDLGGHGAAEVEASSHMAMFRSMDRCMRALGAWHRHAEWQRAQVVVTDRRSAEAAMAEVAQVLRGCKTDVLTEGPAKAALRSYGLPVVEERVAGSADDAARAADALDYPVVLKIESPDVPHKTEAGGVRLNLRSAGEVREAYDGVMASVAAYAPDARISGALVQPMIRRDVELIVGGKIDPLFGPVVVVGLGGIFVELLKDSAVALAPVTTTEARGMLDSLRGRALLDGFRGAPAADMDQLVDVIVRVGEFMADHAAVVEELDINPLVISEGTAIAVDALVSLRPLAVREAA